MSREFVGASRSRRKDGTLLDSLVYSQHSSSKHYTPNTRVQEIICKVQEKCTVKIRSEYTLDTWSAAQSFPPAQEIRAFRGGRGSGQRGEKNAIVDVTLGTGPTRKLKIVKPLV